MKDLFPSSTKGELLNICRGNECPGHLLKSLFCFMEEQLEHDRSSFMGG